MVNRKSWDEFQRSGLLWWINVILHTFGWAIVFERKKDQRLEVYPARVKFRGFSEKDNTEGYRRIAEYMTINSSDIMKEIE